MFKKVQNNFKKLNSNKDEQQGTLEAETLPKSSESFTDSRENISVCSNDVYNSVFGENTIDKNDVEELQDLIDEDVILPVNASLLNNSQNSEYNSMSETDSLSNYFANDHQKGRLAIDSYNKKITKIKEQIKKEQESQNQYVAEFLRLTKNANNSQLNRVKGVFESRQKKSRSNITQLQKKRDYYLQKIKDLQLNTKESKSSTGRLRDVGANLRGITGNIKLNATEVFVNKPKDFANRLKPKNNENIDAIEEEFFDEANSDYDVRKSQQKKSYFLEEESLNKQLDTIVTVMEELRQTVNSIQQSQQKTMNKIKEFEENVSEDMSDLISKMKTEQFHGERLETQVQSLFGFYEQGLNVVKGEVQSIQSRFDYHLRERTRELQDSVTNCHNRLHELEREQRVQRSNDTIVNDSNELVGKMCNLLMGFIALVLVLLTSAYNFTQQLTSTKTRSILTVAVCVISAGVFFYNK